MTAPLVAIPTYRLGPGQVRNWKGAFALPESYVAALRAAGARVALLPPVQPGDPEELLAPFDGLLLAGGGDIEPGRYGADDHWAQYGIDPDRDRLELGLARAAVRLELPVLGICRGVQLLNVAFGGTLVQHLEDGDAKVVHRDDAMQAMHGLRVKPGSRLAEALGQAEAEGLSHHHQALDRLGEGFRPVAWAPDGLVEGIERDDGWTVGVLWHPESTAATDPVQQRLLETFVNVASRRGQAFWRGSAEPVGFGRPGSARRVKRAGRSVRPSR
ncbi:MAG TPA: gamma-glutamyl-gamma-aminobutyrate hydrolase family protein [Actinomycetota bacterium]|nr:gamma-glutamyl-gamma-aminobutyrate hydrolase family protein [Actinomycetota bacterium]